MHHTLQLPRGTKSLPPTEGDLLLSAIRDAPHEMTLKLGFLDWCDENARLVGCWIARAIAREPMLTDQGIGYRNTNGTRCRPTDVLFKQSRAWMPTAVRPFAASLAWLATRGKRKTMNPRRVSYGLKHDVERAFEAAAPGYVPQGVFIAAAIHAGFGWQWVPGTPNCQHAISSRPPSPRRIICRARE
jgi:hypothetical protein